MKSVVSKNSGEHLAGRRINAWPLLSPPPDLNPNLNLNPNPKPSPPASPPPSPNPVPGPSPSPHPYLLNVVIGPDGQHAITAVRLIDVITEDMSGGA